MVLGSESRGELPLVIQGGMGAAISRWRLASAVARAGQLGVVSGVALGAVLARELQDGDPGGHLRRALAAYPDQRSAEELMARYFNAGGRAPGGRYRAVPVPRIGAGRHFLELTIAGAFCEVHLAKEGHAGAIGINLLEKIQIPTLPTLYGAMLARVDWVLMGAGIPYHIPAALNALAEHRPYSLPLAVAGAAAGESFAADFDPQQVLPGARAPLRRPRFLAIVSSHVLASQLARDPVARPDGFVVELPSAGGHNAPPRGRLRLSAAGEPIYGPRDAPDLERIRALGLPFWLAGGYGHPGRLAEALREGAAGVQVGSAFALCEESGFDPALKVRARRLAASGKLRVRTDPLASPTGFPFKVAQVRGTVAQPSVLAARRRVCDVAYLRTLYRRDDGTIGYRCPSEPESDYVAKGGDPADTEGRVCVCNGLIAAAGMAQQRRDAGPEPALMTLGDDACNVVRALAPDGRAYHAAEVLEYLLEGGPARGDQGRRSRSARGSERATDAVTAGLFPGQGSWREGLGERVRALSPELHEHCLELVGEDPFARARESTRFAQPAIYCASIASWLALRGEVRPALLAGHSLGELAALVAAAALDPHAGLRLAVRRGELMALAEGGEREAMLALLGGEESTSAELAARHGLALANDNAPGQAVLAGAVSRLRAAAREARARGTRAIMLDVAGAFHSPAMAPAVEPFAAALAEIELSPLQIPVISAASARPFCDVRRELAEAITRPVRWRETMITLAQLGAQRYLDFGPGEVLARLTKRNLPDAEAIAADALEQAQEVSLAGAR